ncbi:hypothetical protein [Frisingicoccus sp.]|uniref:hypothetical protein n=1 Tax=Frisingicoccus sp. TaxID=1918627 RepID=UPI003AB80998
MNIPEKVKILFKTYDVQQEKNLHDMEGDLYAQIHYLPERIILNEDSTEEQKKAALIHELIHGLDEIYIIGLKEKQIEKLGNALYMLIRDNPEMFKEG